MKNIWSHIFKKKVPSVPAVETVVMFSQADYKKYKPLVSKVPRV